MKKLFFTLAITLGAFAVTNAQGVGQMWVGGNIGYDHYKNELGSVETKVDKIDIVPEFGYVLSENFGVGINVGYTYQKEGSEKTNGFEVAPFVRYSVLKGDIGGFFLDGGAGYEYSKVKDSDTKTNAFEVGIRPGVSINVASNVALIAKFGFIGYDHSKTEVGANDIKNDHFGLRLNTDDIKLGVRFVF